jgi:hypothetical protein
VPKMKIPAHKTYALKCKFSPDSRWGQTYFELNLLESTLVSKPITYARCATKNVKGWVVSKMGIDIARYHLKKILYGLGPHLPWFYHQSASKFDLSTLPPRKSAQGKSRLQKTWEKTSHIEAPKIWQMS